jgi:hypothetical protein
MTTQVENNAVLELEQTAKTYPLTKSDTAFAVFALIASLFTAIFGICGGFALGYFLSVVFMLIIFTVYFARKSKPNFISVFFGLLSLANGVVFITTSNGSVRFFAFAVSFLLALSYLSGLKFGSPKGNRQTVAVFSKAVSSIGKIGISLKSLFASRNGGKKTFGKALLGLVCAFPVLIIVIPLLISSDDAFKGMMSRIFENTFTTFLKANLGIALAIFVIAYGLSLKFGDAPKVRKSNFKGIENVYLISFLSSFAVIYLLYLFSQLAYFFNAFKGFLPEGDITYAQYARKGFAEMCAIAVINLIIVFVSFLLAKKQKGKACLGVKLLATFIAIFTLIIIATAISKMVLYIGVYGMTVKRLTTSAFMVFLSIVFISLALRVYFKKVNVIKIGLATAGVVVLLLGTLNVNSICAEYNYQAYINKKLDTVDITALYELGDEGVPYLTKFACAKDIGLAKHAQYYLAELYCNEEYFDNMDCPEGFDLEHLKANQKDTSFSKFSLPRQRAYDALYTFFEKNPTFDKTCVDYIYGSLEFPPSTYDINSDDYDYDSYSDESDDNPDYPDDKYV